MVVGEMFNQFVKSLSVIYDKNEATRITEWVFEDILNVHFSNINQYLNVGLTELQQEILALRLKRLLQSEPVQYVLGYAYFMDLKLTVNRHVLIPRPETEELVELILKSEKEFKGTIVDIGTGSGCIAIAIAKKFKDACINATDVSEHALKVALGNAQQHKITCSFICDSILSPTWNEYPQVDLIVSNPPYIHYSEADTMHKNVLDYEPNTALFTAKDALQFYKALLDFAHIKLKPLGKVYFELNPLFAHQTANLFIETGYTNVQLYKDLSGKERFMSAIKKGG